MSLKNHTILLVEDNPDDVDLTLRAFERDRFGRLDDQRIDVVRDGQEALDYLFASGPFTGRDPHHPPQVVLLDLKLPKVDGLEVLRRVRADERTRLVPIVVLSSSNRDDDLVSCYQAGANSYVRKSVDFIEFANAIRQLGVYWLVVNEPPPEPGSPLP